MGRSENGFGIRINPSKSYFSNLETDVVLHVLSKRKKDSVLKVRKAITRVGTALKLIAM